MAICKLIRGINRQRSGETMNKMMVYALLGILFVAGIILVTWSYFKSYPSDATVQCIPLPYQIYEQFPKPGAKDVPVTTNITVTFSRSPSIVKLEAEPKIEIGNITKENVSVASGRFTFHPGESLRPETTYTITITYGQEEVPQGYCQPSATTWQFTTGSGK